MLECVINLSEGRSEPLLARLGAAAGSALLDVHRDPDHHRAVLTLAGPDVEAAARSVASLAVRLLDLGAHAGVHPRIGVVDVVPFVPLAGSDLADAVAARDRFARWAGEDLAVPCFLYGPDRSLPEVRREAFHALMPDTGPAVPHPTAGAIAVGARPVLVAYNLWVAGAGPDSSRLARARQVAALVRGPAVRALGLAVGDRVQVSCNLIDPDVIGPQEIYDRVADLIPLEGAELVGLIPAAVLARIPEPRWAALDLAESRTIEARLQQAGLDGGSATTPG